MSASPTVSREPDRPQSLAEFHLSSVPMWVFDQKTLAILEVNGAATEQYGYSRSEFLKMTLLDFRPIEDIPKLLQSALRSPGPRNNNQVWRHQKKDGTVFGARVVSWEVIFDGRRAELVSAESVQTGSA